MMGLPRVSLSLGGVMLCGAFAFGAVTLVPVEARADAQASRDARFAYETGLVLHEQGEYEAAIGEFIEAIGTDPTLQDAYSALTAAEVAASKARLELAVAAADVGNLAAAARHAERAAQLDGENDRAVAASLSVTAPERVLTRAQLTAFDRAQALADDKQWKLAREQFAALVDDAPLWLPARSALAKARHFEGRANELADTGAAMMQQGRLSPAVEQLAGAVAIWPYHPDASALLEEAQQRAQRATEEANAASAALRRGELDEALRLARSAQSTDSANARARAVERDAARQLADRAVAEGDALLEAGDFAGARTQYAAALAWKSNYPDARLGTARSYRAQGAALADADRPGAAMLAYLAGREHHRGTVRSALSTTEDRLLADTGVSYALSVPDHEPGLGVDSGTLRNALLRQREPGYFADPADGEPRYIVRVQINSTDITLRRLRTPGSTYLRTNGYTAGESQWEKRGTVACTVSIVDRETEETVRRWNANRWVSYTDTQQYYVGSSWRRSYWTLPSDSAVTAELADDLADAVWPRVIEEVALARARALRDAADAPDAAVTPEQAMEMRVAATLLAAQVNEREGERALREMALEFAEAEAAQ